MPPTTGHLQLIQFADLLASDGVEVILSTQPAEPFAYERADAIRRAVRSLNKVHVRHIHETMEQNPEAPGFWEMWKRLMTDVGATSTDYVVASEPYGKKVAALTGSQFFPYDIDRSINPVKATPIRQAPLKHFGDILPEFQPYLQTRVTIFGAESTGKTTLSRELGAALEGYTLFEYARPYLEQTVNEITPRSMTGIWKGQAALQRQAQNLHAKPYIVQDTDLFTTIGYWLFPHWRPMVGDCPQGLIDDAMALKSDLYVITPSNIPFEPDPLRYGGDEREGSDDYWITICKAYGLPYVVLKSQDQKERLKEATMLIRKAARQKVAPLAYDRQEY